MASIERLSQDITDKSQPIATRRAAVIEIAAIGGNEVLPYIFEALTDDAPGVRREAATVLQNFSTPEVTAAIIDAIRSEENDLTLWTFIEVLGTIGTLTALPVLQDLLAVTLSPLTRRVVQNSIDQITDRLPNNEISPQDYEHDEIEENTDTDDLETDQPEINLESSEESGIEVLDDQDLSEDSDETSVTNDEETTDIDIVEEENQQSEQVEAEDPAYSELPDEESFSSSEDSDYLSHDLHIDGSGNEKTQSSPSLPVLVPNTSVVIYEEEETRFQPSVFDMVLRPNAYLSKRWVSRTRIYLVLLFFLVVSTIFLIYSQSQRRPRSPYKANPELAFMENPDKYLNAGSFFIQQGDFHSAIETLEYIRGVDTIDIDLYRNLGYAYFQEEQYALAAESYEYYLNSRQSGSYQPFVAEAAYREDGDDISDDVSEYITYNLLGTAYKRLGNMRGAQSAFEAAIKIAPFEAEAYSNLAQLYTDGFQQRPHLAEALAYAAVSLNPDVAPHQDTLGWIYGKNGRINRAANILKQAIRLQQDYIPAHYHLVEIVSGSNTDDTVLNVVRKDLVDKMRPSSNSYSTMLDVLSYIYETNSQKIPRLSSSILHLKDMNKW